MYDSMSRDLITTTAVQPNQRDGETTEVNRAGWTRASDPVLGNPWGVVIQSMSVPPRMLRGVPVVIACQELDQVSPTRP
jgi:hypothetical protein